jgi:hypothetical protein
VDGLLGRRREQDHEATTSLKTEFMQLWVRSDPATCWCVYRCGWALDSQWHLHIATVLPTWAA